MENRFPHGLAGDGAGIDTHPTHGSHPFHHRGPFAQLVGVDGSALPRRARTNDEYVVGNHALKEGYRKNGGKGLISYCRARRCSRIGHVFPGAVKNGVTPEPILISFGEPLGVAVLSRSLNLESGWHASLRYHRSA
jgi:hypothetical protein